MNPCVFICVCIYAVCQNETAKFVCVCMAVSVNLLHAHTVCVSAGESQTVKLMKRATGQVWCGKRMHGSADMCNCSNWLSGVVLREIRAAAQAERGSCVHVFTPFKSKIDVR